MSVYHLFQNRGYTHLNINVRVADAERKLGQDRARPIIAIRTPEEPFSKLDSVRVQVWRIRRADQFAMVSQLDAQPQHKHYYMPVHHEHLDLQHKPQGTNQIGVSEGARKKYCTRHSSACTVTMFCEAMTAGRYRRARAKYASVEFSDSGTRRAPMAYITQIKKAPGMLKHSNGSRKMSVAYLFASQPAHRQAHKRLHPGPDAILEADSSRQCSSEPGHRNTPSQGEPSPVHCLEA